VGARLALKTSYTRSVANPARRVATVSDLDKFGEDDHVEIINGELVQEAMTSFEHGDAQSSMSGELKWHFRGGGPPGGEGWWIATEVDVVYADTQCFRHDISGWRKARVHERPVGTRVQIRPDCVCEVLSTNRNKDLVDKRRVLHQQGVPHYWIVDLDGPLLTVLRHHADGYLMVATVAPGERARLEPFDAVELEVSRLFGDIA
jgi:Uma2 family endonuclease